jgi:RHS repeat-associated protein
VLGTLGNLAQDGQVSTTRTYDSNGNLLGVRDADAVAGNTQHTDATNCTIASVAYTACAQFDGLYSALPTQITQALTSTTDESSSFNYTTDGANPNSPDATNGWGTWLTSSSDANGQTTSYAYDALGRLTATAQPGYSDTLSSPTTSYSYQVTCATTGASEPCTALLATQRLSGTTTVTSATYYDGWGRAVETVKPQNYSGGACTFVVQYTTCDASGRQQYQSDPYFVGYTQADCAPRYFRPDLSKPLSSQSYDGLGRVVAASDMLGNVTNTSYSEAQPQGVNVGDTNWYEATTVVDANSHQRTQLVDGFGHTRYVETFTGTSASGYSLYGVTSSKYDWLGDTLSVTGPALSGGAGLSTSMQTSSTYDLLGRALTLNDADLGNGWAYTYDANGNLLSTQDPRPSGGMVWIGYDGQNRPLWRNTTNSGSGAYVTYGYDSTASGNQGKGRLTSESFTGGTASDPLSGAYSYSYDARGQVTLLKQTTTELVTYNVGYGYNDAGQPTTVTYTDGETLGYSYTSYGWLQNATTPTANLALNLSYTNSAGAAGKPTGASLANNTYSWSATYDTDLRLTNLSVLAGSTTEFALARSFDAVGNVTSAYTTLPAGQDHQTFCYDAQNRLTWAGSSGTPSCGSGLAAGTLTAAYYSSSFSYDAQNRLTSTTTQGSYSYGDPAHLHAATATSTGGYSGSYDAAGDLVCRAPSSGTTCSGTQTGAQLSYDAERRLTHWQNAPSSPATQADELYDGAGERVEQKTITSSLTTRTYYLAGGLEEIAANGSTVTTTKYYSVPGVCTVVNAGGTLSYLAQDGLGSVTAALSTSGSVTSTARYAPYGGVRYSSGAMPTAKGFTGQQGDATTGLDYDHARYYDPLLGQFASADTDARGE